MSPLHILRYPLHDTFRPSKDTFENRNTSANHIASSDRLATFDGMKSISELVRTDWDIEYRSSLTRFYRQRFFNNSNSPQILTERLRFLTCVDIYLFREFLRWLRRNYVSGVNRSSSHSLNNSIVTELRLKVQLKAAIKNGGY